MSKHTPDKWTCAPDESENGEWDVKSGQWFVAVCCTNPGDGDTEANAHLIAAAPELLEALTLIVAELDRLPKDHPQWPTSPMREASVAAIAKARGES